MKWILGDKLGFGQFALVYECAPADAPEDFGFARKRLQSDSAKVEVIVKRFEREVQILEALDHPNVMSVIDSGASSKGPWFVMPKADISLEKMLENPFTRLGTDDWAPRTMLGVLAGSPTPTSTATCTATSSP